MMFMSIDAPCGALPSSGYYYVRGSRALVSLGR